jgi:hypothetical protein
MVELVLALVTSCGLALISRRNVPATVSVKKVNTALGGAIVTVLLFFLVAHWLGYAVAVGAGAVLALGMVGLAWRVIQREKTVLEPESERLSMPMEKNDVDKEESPVLPQPLASETEETPERENASDLEETLEAEQVEEILPPREENEEAEPAFRSLSPDDASEPVPESGVLFDTEPTADSQDELLLSDLSMLLEPYEPDLAKPTERTAEIRAEEHSLLDDTFTGTVLQMEELFADSVLDGEASPDMRESRSMAWMELDEIKVGEDGSTRLGDTRKSV